MIFDPTPKQFVLHLRRPRLLWILLGLVSAIFAGAFAATAIVFFAEIPLRIAHLAGADRLAFDALGAPLAAGQLFAIAGAAAAIFVGAPWFGLTLSRPRKRRTGVIIEGIWIAVASAVAAGIVIGAWTTSHVLLRDGAETTAQWLNAAGVFGSVVLFIGAFGALLAAPAGLAAGAALAMVSFRRAEAIEPEPDSLNPFYDPFPRAVEPEPVRGGFGFR